MSEKKSSRNWTLAPLLYFSFCAGIGGAELAFLNVFPKAKCAGYCEINEDCINIYKRHFPNHKNFGDVTRLRLSDLPEFDVLIGGPPCQGFSNSGNRGSFGDERCRLFYYYVMILRYRQPRYYIMENVGSMTLEDQATISAVLCCQPVALNSVLFTPQNRNRLFWANFEIYAPSIIGERPTLANILQPVGTVSYAYEINETNLRHIQIRELVEFAGNEMESPFCFGLERLPQHSGVSNANYSMMQPNIRTDGIANTVTTFATYLNVVYDGNMIRYLTPVEFERLQDLPDNYTDYLPTENRRIAVIGNCFTIGVIEHILRYLKIRIEQDFTDESL